MRTFNYDSIQPATIPNEVKMYVSLINEFKRKQEYIYSQQSDILDNLVAGTKIQSTGASNRIEGIATTDKRLRDLMEKDLEPHNKAEKEILGYRFCLDLIEDYHDEIVITSEYILQLQGYLLQHVPNSMGGSFKNADNMIEDTDKEGKKRVWFVPVTAAQTQKAMNDLCSSYNRAFKKGEISSLILSMQFVFDFLCIHPFNEGNSRMSRILMQMLLYRDGYYVGKYISIEAMIERTKDSYFDALRASSQGWHEGVNDSWAFVRYMLGNILAAYREFENRVTTVTEHKMSKEERVRKGIRETRGLFTKAGLMEKYPDISIATMERVLSQLKAEGVIETLGTGRSAKWKKK